MRVFAFLLLTIFVCDAVGEPQGTLDEQAVRRQLLDLLIQRHHGNEYGTMGESKVGPFAGSEHRPYSESEDEFEDGPFAGSEHRPYSESDEDFEEGPMGESEEETEPMCENPCLVFGGDGEDYTDEFYNCIMDKGLFIENELNRMFREKTGKNLFEDKEMEVIWHLRTNWAFSREMKQILEMFINEIGAGRFMSGLGEEDLTAEEQVEIEELICQYSLIGSEFYQTLAKK